jgi:mannose-1-phosphate guanylyltransferase
MPYSEHSYAVILAGGGGTRLWPQSRKQTPKQFLELTSNRTMMQVATDRISKFIPWDRIIVVTNKIYTQEVRKQLPEIAPLNIISEPEKKDTAIAMLTGALYAKSKDPKAVVINAASDHTLIDEKEFMKVMKAAITIAAENESLVSVGITPTYPHTGFGYIKAGEDIKKIDHNLSVFKVLDFAEKPNLATAIAYISTGKYFWNANMYVWSAQTIQNAFAKYMPDMYQLTKGLDKFKEEKFHQALAKIYKQVESISIDYAISEKANNLLLIPGDFGWNDVGDWKVVYDLSSKDLDGNVIRSDKGNVPTVNIKSKNNLIYSNGKLIATYGINDMIIVDTGEILLVCPKDQSQQVKKLVERLKEEGKKEYL